MYRSAHTHTHAVSLCKRVHILAARMDPKLLLLLLLLPNSGLYPRHGRSVSVSLVGRGSFCISLSLARSLGSSSQEVERVGYAPWLDGNICPPPIPLLFATHQIRFRESLLGQSISSCYTVFLVCIDHFVDWTVGNSATFHSLTHVHVVDFVDWIGLAHELIFVSLGSFFFFCREQPIFTCKAHVFHIDPKTKRSWIPASSSAINVSFFYDSTRSLYRIISVEGTKVCTSNNSWSSPETFLGWGGTLFL